ncbi:Retrovirus-related Pol polyprotein from type-1 retrotransposable element R2 [Stylophora pistillata]|uniref:Retrovirus-related Pol polyprotein from type-1 retrotransposable element R2 n=1 Tax=Stylophora pistillata TaxID=50429 RepID=A0A2B4SUU5_STYPI|nr:Retrovirus-related Pol polyprotein from type-1 retrotransposable element R2 [Stylophora pistillata]
MMDERQDRLTYQRVGKNINPDSNTNTFENIEEASRFWQSLLETRGSGNEKTEWLLEMKEAIAEQVLTTVEREWNLETPLAVKTLLKKRNFSAPGPDRLTPLDKHLSDYNLMEGEQRGAKSGCSGTTDNLMIDRMVTQDCLRGKRNLSMTCVDVRKAYDSVDHNWLIEMMEVHRVPAWIGKVIKHLSASWNTKIVATTKQGSETSTIIRFHKGLPQGDALFSELFRLCLNPVAWILNATEGYRLSKPLSTRITHLLYVDDLKVFAASETKLNQVLRSTCTAMQDMGLHWNPKKCSAIHVRRGKQVQDAKDVKLNETSLIEKSSQMFDLVHIDPGNYENREIDTRTKEKPTKKDSENINIALNEIINQHNVSPTEDPFIYLWMVNCALCSATAAFLPLKRWKRSTVQDARQVYAKFTEMMDHRQDRLTYQRVGKNINPDSNTNTFENIEEASRFWQSLWETRGSGNEKTEWLLEMKEAVAEQVPTTVEREWNLETPLAVKTLLKKRNFSAPSPDRLVNGKWWKCASSLHEGVTRAFESISKYNEYFPLWFSEGKTRLTPKPGDFSSENQRPITCLNNINKWFTSCLQTPLDKHLNDYDLMEGEQRGAKSGCSGTTDNLMIDRMVTQDCHRGKRNLSMAWVDVRKAYDSVDHNWLIEMMEVHRVPAWIGKVIKHLSASWNTKIVATTKQGSETSTTIRFHKGLPQGDALCPRLFTLCLNPVAWLLNATEGYRLSKPLSARITHLLYVDDLKVFAASETKLNQVLRSTCTAMQDMGLHWNPKKCSAIHVRRGKQVQDAKDVKLNETILLQNKVEIRMEPGEVLAGQSSASLNMRPLFHSNGQSALFFFAFFSGAFDNLYL